MRTLLLVALLISSPAFAETFEEWAGRFKAEAAAKHKLAQAPVDSVLAIAVYEPKIVELDRKQPEFIKSFWKYYDAAMSPARIASGREMMRKHAKLLEQIARKYKVQPHILVAFWGMETNYGRNFGGFALASALATLAYDGRRAEFFTRELVEFVRIVGNGHLAASAKGSWAGAFGNFQFMPSTFVRYAIDGSGDKKIDLFSNLADAFSSAANYLSQMGWNGREKWGRAVRFAQENAEAWEAVNLYEYKTVSEWAAMGVRAYDGSELPSSDISAALVMPQGDTGPAFLVYPNFKLIMKWNASVSYALSVGLLSDAIVGKGDELSRRPDVDVRPLSIEQLKELQERIGAPVDGILGRATLRAVKEYQKNLVVRGITKYKSGRDIYPDGYPDLELYEVEK
ncbi:MAG: lytic murein transglycosylase [Rickettsiales bacterium]|nr:lytic murein transglycosylase [Rickettsiales bacterium]